MNTEKKEISKAFELVQFVWDKDQNGSWLLLNPLLQDALELAIKMKLEFNKNTFDNIHKNFNGDYWFGANSNRKGTGEIFYNLACTVGNTSAAQSYESFYNFKPFISKKGNRLHQHSELCSTDRRFRVTGFDFDTKKIHFVSYELSDWKQKGKRQLHCFDNKEWNEFRKQLEEF
jgi:hypothetical protein